jgi:hypothetical protein
MGFSPNTNPAYEGRGPCEYRISGVEEGCGRVGIVSFQDGEPKKDNALDRASHLGMSLLSHPRIRGRQTEKNVVFDRQGANMNKGVRSREGAEDMRRAAKECWTDAMSMQPLDPRRCHPQDTQKLHP